MPDVLQVREEMGLRNVQVMIPFVRTVDEAETCIDLMAKNGLERSKNDLKVHLMCEIPANALLAKDFLKVGRRFDQRCRMFPERCSMFPERC